jgi:hypothetical protein
VGGVLVYAGYLKAKEPWIVFAGQVDAFKLLSEDMVTFVAKTLPWFEIVLGAVLILGVGLRWTATAASLLLGTFFVVLTRSYLLGMDIDCGCFGPGDKLTGLSLLRDGLLLAVSIAVTAGAFLAARRPDAAQPLPGEPAGQPAK